MSGSTGSARCYVQPPLNQCNHAKKIFCHFAPNAIGEGDIELAVVYCSHFTRIELVFECQIKFKEVMT